MDLIAYFPAGMKKGDELSVAIENETNPDLQTVEVVAAEDWRVTLKSDFFSFSVATSKNVASSSSPSKIRVGEMTYAAKDALGDVSAGWLVVSGLFGESAGSTEIPAEIETSYLAAQNPENPAVSTLQLGDGFGDFANRTLEFQLVVG